MFCGTSIIKGSHAITLALGKPTAIVTIFCKPAVAAAKVSFCRDLSLL